jgi:hypothetical protein
LTTVGGLVTGERTGECMMETFQKLFLAKVKVQLSSEISKSLTYVSLTSRGQVHCMSRQSTSTIAQKIFSHKKFEKFFFFEKFKFYFFLKI